jgi:hypothetical protein
MPTNSRTSPTVISPPAISISTPRILAAYAPGDEKAVSSEQLYLKT